MNKKNIHQTGCSERLRESRIKLFRLQEPSKTVSSLLVFTGSGSAYLAKACFYSNVLSTSALAFIWCEVCLRFSLAPYCCKNRLPPETCIYSNIDPLDPHCCNRRSQGATCFYSNMEFSFLMIVFYDF